MAKTKQAKLALESVFSSQDFHSFEIMEDILRDNGVDVDGVRDAFDKSKLIGDSPQKRFYRGQNKQQNLERLLEDPEATNIDVLQEGMRINKDGVVEKVKFDESSREYISADRK